MAEKGDEAARVERARDLRERIRRLLAGEDATVETPAAPSPRDFIHKRMRERDLD